MRRQLPPAIDGARQAQQARLQARIRLQQRLILQMHLFHHSFAALVRLVKFLDRLIVVLGRQQLFALNPHRLGDQQRLLRHAGVKR